MAAKRKSAALEGLAIEDISSVTADMADELRSRLIEQKRRKTKKRLRTGLSIDIGNNQPPQGALTFFGLPQELWDEVYRYLWEESPLIKQQYLQRYYTVTYGERHDLLSLAVWSLDSYAACHGVATDRIADECYRLHGCSRASILWSKGLQHSTDALFGFSSLGASLQSHHMCFHS